MSKKPTVLEGSIHDFVPDMENGNLGSQRGQELIENSLTEDGAARGLLDLIYRKWPYREVLVSVFEDGEVGARVSTKPFEPEEL